MNLGIELYQVVSKCLLADAKRGPRQKQWVRNRRFLWPVVIPLDQLRPLAFTFMRFQRPFGQRANIALELEKVA